MIVTGKKRYWLILGVVVITTVLILSVITRKNSDENSHDAKTSEQAKQLTIQPIPNVITAVDTENNIDDTQRKKQETPQAINSDGASNATNDNKKPSVEDTLLIQALETPDLSFPEWKKRFSLYAHAHGVDKNTLDTTLIPLNVNDKVLKLIAKQPEFTKPIWQYLDTAVSAKRVLQGRRLLARHHELLQQVEKHYGVQAEYLVAIWGLETGYGSNFGSNNVLRSLATLAYGSERKAFYRSELISALKIIQQGDISADKMIGSWAGAMGHTQFMPSTYENFAVSFDGDKQRDLWHSLQDVFASTANYLEKSGWQKNQLWGIEVKLPDSMNWEFSDPAIWLTMTEWGDAGITRVDGRPLNTLDTKKARLFLPAGHKGPAFLAFHNFLAIKKYNNANSYALAVAYLGDRIRGSQAITAKWPRDDMPLSFNENKDLQSFLSALGYDTGEIDGKIGPNTRQALRHWQKDKGLPADGYVNKHILELLR